MQLFNASATLNVPRLLYNPSLCVPHVTAKSFDKLTFPLIVAGHPIKALVLDKDNCFAKDGDDKVWPEYLATWQQLQKSYPKELLLIVSNSAGTDDDLDHVQAAKLEHDTGVTVLRHSTKKPGCQEEILAYFAAQGIDKAGDIAVVGDRLFTDVMMANLMGSHAVWLSDGVERSEKLWVRLERGVNEQLATRNVAAPTPKI